MGTGFRSSEGRRLAHGGVDTRVSAAAFFCVGGDGRTESSAVTSGVRGQGDACGCGHPTGTSVLFEAMQANVMS